MGVANNIGGVKYRPNTAWLVLGGAIVGTFASWLR
jgi:hypothetical protein